MEDICAYAESSAIKTHQVIQDKAQYKEKEREYLYVHILTILAFNYICTVFQLPHLISIL